MLQRPVSGAVPERQLLCRLVSGEPEVERWSLQPGEDRFVVLASDGLWDVLEDADAVGLAQVGLGWHARVLRAGPQLSCYMLCVRAPAAHQLAC